MRDQEIKDLIGDLESVGLSDDPSTVEVGKDGVESIDYENSELNIIYLLKKGSYSRIEAENNYCYLISENFVYSIICRSDESARKVAKKIQNFLNS